ncbi:hypothetical protein BJY52DRAFT_1225914 [Lactarius psammicola]|nr:hypothetical protein BJY52DRAFT_1225914 [Lactarius psammicola]
MSLDVEFPTQASRVHQHPESGANSAPPPSPGSLPIVVFSSLAEDVVHITSTQGKGGLTQGDIKGPLKCPWDPKSCGAYMRSQSQDCEQVLRYYLCIAIHCCSIQKRRSSRGALSTDSGRGIAGQSLARDAAFPHGAPPQKSRKARTNLQQRATRGVRVSVSGAYTRSWTLELQHGTQTDGGQTPIMREALCPEYGLAWVERHFHPREELDFVEVDYRRQSAKRVMIPTQRTTHATHPARVD